MKRLLFLLTMLLVTMQSLWAEEVPSNQIWYTTTDQQRIEPNDNGSIRLEIKSNVMYENGKGVLTFGGDLTSLGFEAFSGNQTLVTLQLPSTVTDFGLHTFKDCHALKSVNIPKGVTEIRQDVFNDCTALAEIDIPEGVTWIAPWAFANCPLLKQIVLPSTVDQIGSYAFYNSGITSIVIPDKVQRIEQSAFKQCRSLESVILPEGIKAIETEVFCNCPNLKTLVVPCLTPPVLEGQSFAGTTSVTVYVPAKALDAYRKSPVWSGWFGNRIAPIPDQIYYRSATKLNPVGDKAFGEAKVVAHEFADSVGMMIFDRPVVQIGDGAFADSKALTEIVWPEGVKTLGKEAFRGCTSLKVFTITDSIASLGAGLFKGCSNLTTVICKPRVAPEVTDDCFQGTAASLRVRVDHEVLDTYLAHPGWAKHKALLVSDLPAADEVFYTTTDGSTVRLSEFAFDDAKVVSNVYVDGRGIITLDRPLTKVYNGIFYRNEKLRSISFPEGLLSIGNDAFTSCDNLKNVVLPSTLTSIGSYAFAFCSSLADVELPASLTSIGESAFTDCNAFTSVIVPEGVTEIATHAFSASKSLTSVILPTGVKKIGNHAFYNCSALSTVVCLADAVPTVFDVSFGGVQDSCRIFVKGDLVEAYKAAWPLYAHMIRPYNPASNQILYTTTDNKILFNTLGDFGGAKIVKHEYTGGQGIITFDKTITTVGIRAFADCGTLATIDLPETVSRLGSLAFAYCTSLKEFDIPAGVTYLEHGTFLACLSLPSLVVPEGVTGANTFVFSDCGALKSISLPKTLCTIGDNSFQGCPSLESIVIPDGVTNIPRQLFDDCQQLTTVLLPKSIKYIDNHAFNRCFALESVLCTAPTPPDLDEMAFPEAPGTKAILYVPEKLMEKYYHSPLHDLGGFRFVRPIPGQIVYTADRKIEPNPIQRPFGEADIAYNDFADGVGVITFDRPVEILNDDVFTNNPYITSIIIPEEIEYIGRAAFKGCHGLYAVHCKAWDEEHLTKISDMTFDDVRLDFRIFVPHNVVEYYQERWQPYGNAILPDSLAIPSQGWTSLFAPNDLYINDGLRAFYAKAVITMTDSVIVVLKQIHDVIPANTPVLIGGAEGVYPALFAQKNTAKAVEKNLFHGTLTRKRCSELERYYVLSKSSTPEVAEFAAPESTILHAQTAYLTASGLNADTAVDKIYFQIEETPTGITDPAAPSKVDAPRKVVIDGQIYIKHGGHLYNTMGVMVK
ncbi:MAG: leucine-rich repeat domain-containing protein [Bacteroidales bacterium]|nr:leucine-rich repeat domain-containing protein [Bacteroidales bacterium]